MEPTRASSDDFEFLRFHWSLAIEKGLSFMPGTPWFSSEFFVKLRGNCSHTTIDTHFERLGLAPLKDTSGQPIKDGQFFFWNLLEMRRL